MPRAVYTTFSTHVLPLQDMTSLNCIPEALLMEVGRYIHTNIYTYAQIYVYTVNSVIYAGKIFMLIHHFEPNFIFAK